MQFELLVIATMELSHVHSFVGPTLIADDENPVTTDELDTRCY